MRGPDMLNVAIRAARGNGREVQRLHRGDAINELETLKGVYDEQAESTCRYSVRPSVLLHATPNTNLACVWWRGLTGRRWSRSRRQSPSSICSRCDAPTW